MNHYEEKLEPMTKPDPANPVLKDWRYEPDNGKIVAADNGAVLYISAYRMGDGQSIPDSTTAIGRLAAAAPAMREVLLAFIRYDDADGESGVEMMLAYAEAIEMARAALAAAGEE